MSNEDSRQESDAGQTFFPHVYESELEEIRSSREKRGVATNGLLNHDLIGLAFSGGGIRSATFNLGVLQALANHHLLSKIDYLSTVSGGGYIGSWLSSWAYQLHQQNSDAQAVAQIEERLNSTPQNIGGDPEPAEVSFLRKYSNYLTPSLGILSGDTLAFIATYLRNLLLNLGIVISALMAVLLLPRTIELVFQRFSGARSVEICGDLAIVLLVITLFLVQSNVRDVSSTPPSSPGRFAKLKNALPSQWREISARNVFRFIAVPLFGSSLLFAFAVWGAVSLPLATGSSWFAHWMRWPDWLLVSSAGAAYTVLWTFADLIQRRKQGRSVPRWCAFPAGLAGGSLLLLLKDIFIYWSHSAHRLSYLVTCGVPLVAVAFLLVGIAHLGLIGRNYGDLSREWWARLGGIVLAIAVCWSLVCAVALFAPLLPPVLHHYANEPAQPWVQKLWKILGTLGITTVITGWLAATFAGLFAAKSTKTGPVPTQNSTSKTYDRLARVAPPVFIAGLMIALSLALNKIFPAPTWWLVCSFAIILYAISRLLGWRVDVNEFSLHNAYRNRLVRCYLGATHTHRQEQPFTGFDAKDDINMQDLRGLGAPFHIINATLNVTKGKELALQSRKARSFVFTPLFSGFEDKDNPGGKDTGCYRETADCSKRGPRPGIRLGAAMAISGAALSPNMGHYSSGAVSFLLTVFSVRLGWWLGNPRRKQDWESKEPRSSWSALIRELTGSANEDQSEIYLSDGGHFENLGVYELVRRRCRLIIACDAGCDDSYACKDLASVIEKCRVDFGTKINIAVNDVSPSAELVRGGKTIRLSKQAFVEGTISYPHGEGKLVYIKPSLNADLPQDLISYACSADSFPHQSTGDQYFDEAQFESYRSLGFACATAAVKKIQDELPRPQLPSARGTAA